MAGVSKTPIAAAVLVKEMVGGFIVLMPLMVASTVSYLVTGSVVTRIDIFNIMEHMGETHHAC